MWNRWPGRGLIALAVVSWLALALSQAGGESRASRRSDRRSV